MGGSERCNYICCKEENKPGLSGFTGLVSTSSLIQETTLITATPKAEFLGIWITPGILDMEPVRHADRDTHGRLSSACSCLILHNKQGPEIKIPASPFLIVFPHEKAEPRM